MHQVVEIERSLSVAMQLTGCLRDDIVRGVCRKDPVRADQSLRATRIAAVLLYYRLRMRPREIAETLGRSTPRIAQIWLRECPEDDRAAALDLYDDWATLTVEAAQPDDDWPPAEPADEDYFPIG